MAGLGESPCDARGCCREVARRSENLCHQRCAEATDERHVEKCRARSGRISNEDILTTLQLARVKPLWRIGVARKEIFDQQVRLGRAASPINNFDPEKILPQVRPFVRDKALQELVCFGVSELSQWSELLRGPVRSCQ